MIGPSFISNPNSVETIPSASLAWAVFTIFEAWVRAAMIDFDVWQFTGRSKRNLCSSTGIEMYLSGDIYLTTLPLEKAEGLAWIHISSAEFN